MPNPILGSGGFHHVCIRTRHWDRTLAFYRDILGCTEKIAWQAKPPNIPPHRAVMLDTGDGNYVEVFEHLDHSPAPNGSVYHFAFRTTRLDEVAARVRQAGEKITVEPKDVKIVTTNGRGEIPVRLFFCEGPNGESIEFFQNTIT
jgi:glyoxylase I family protein